MRAGGVDQRIGDRADILGTLTGTSRDRIMARSYDLAHIQQQGVDLIIIPLDSSFGQRSNADQNAIVAALQACARSAGLRGVVVPVWNAGGGRMGFLAQRNWHAFFSSINLAFVAQNINRRLTCE